MEDLLISTLQEICENVFLQGSMLPDQPYPANFFTFWNFSSKEEAHYDNTEHATIWEYDVNFYSSNPGEVYEKLRSAVKALKKNGFIITDGEHAVASDESTHDGRGISVVYIERSKK